MSGTQAIQGAPRGKTFHMDPEEIEIPPPGHFLHDPSSPTVATPGLVRRIETLGFFGVITITKLDGRPYVLLGRDRLLAAREVNRRRVEAGEEPLTVECQYRVCNDVALAVRMIAAENKTRRKVTQVADARYAVMLEEKGFTLEMLAVEFECSRATIRNLLQLGRQPTFVLAAVQRGEIGATAARKLEGTDAQKADALEAAKAKGGAGAGKGRPKDPKKVLALAKKYGLSSKQIKDVVAAWKKL